MLLLLAGIVPDLHLPGVRDLKEVPGFCREKMGTLPLTTPIQRLPMYLGPSNEVLTPQTPKGFQWRGLGMSWSSTESPSRLWVLQLEETRWDDSLVRNSRKLVDRTKRNEPTLISPMIRKAQFIDILLARLDRKAGRKYPQEVLDSVKCWRGSC